MASEPMTLTARVESQAATDPAFRRTLLADPRAALEGMLGGKLPPGVGLAAQEDGSGKVRLSVTPPDPAPRELTDEELGMVAGGNKYCWNTDPVCWDTKDCVFFTL